MSTLQRGSVVSCGRSVAVVWLVKPNRLMLLPVVAGPPVFAGDVPIDGLADELLTRVTGDSVIRAGAPVWAPPEKQIHLGELSGPAQCRLSIAAIRVFNEASVVQRWTDERVHRERAAQERCAL